MTFNLSDFNSAVLTHTETLICSVDIIFGAFIWTSTKPAFKHKTWFPGFKLLKWRCKEPNSNQDPCTSTKALQHPWENSWYPLFLKGFKSKSQNSVSQQWLILGEIHMPTASATRPTWFSLLCSSWKTGKRANHKAGSAGLTACSQADRLHFPDPLSQCYRAVQTQHTQL